MSLKVGGGLAQSGTFSESENPEVIVIAMSSHRRHVTKPVCEITYGVREEGIETSVLVLNKGMGIPEDSPFVGAPSGSTCEITDDEIKQINRHKLAVIHLGGVKEHVIHKARSLLKCVKIPVIVVCQAAVDFEDFAKVGLKTKAVKPKANQSQSTSEIVDVVIDVTRGISVQKDKLDEIIRKLKSSLK
jgi:methyl-coenzyme M reductase subunit C